jgi:CHASE3 domain sensor protein
MKILKYLLITILVVVMIVGYTYWMNYDLETNIKFSETGMYFDENGNSREIDIEFDVTILQN